MKLLDLLLEDFGQKNNRIVAEMSHHHMMPTEPVDCYVGYNGYNEKVMEPRPLHDPKTWRDLISNIDFHIYNYIRHLSHIEEGPSIISASKMRYDPKAVSKLDKPTNIKFEYTRVDIDTVKLDMLCLVSPVISGSDVIQC